MTTATLLTGTLVLVALLASVAVLAKAWINDAKAMRLSDDWRRHQPLRDPGPTLDDLNAADGDGRR